MKGVLCAASAVMVVELTQNDGISILTLQISITTPSVSLSISVHFDIPFKTERKVVLLDDTSSSQHCARIEHNPLLNWQMNPPRNHSLVSNKHPRPRPALVV